jgi:hypothetical protein
MSTTMVRACDVDVRRKRLHELLEQGPVTPSWIERCGKAERADRS